MKTTISNLTSALMLSAQVPDVNIFTEDDSVTVEVAANGTTLLSEPYYPYDGRVTVRDIRSLIEEYMTTNSISYCSVTLSAKSDSAEDSKEFQCLFCERNVSGYLDVELWLTENFLTTASDKVMPEDGIDRLSYFAKSGERATVTAYLKYIDADGVQNVATIAKSSNSTFDTDEICTVDIDIANLISKLQSKVGAGCKLLAVTVEAVDRSITYYIVHRTTQLRFVFRNSFGAYESIYLWGTTTDKTVVDRSVAVLSARSQFYDRTVTEQFEVEISNITKEDAYLLSQLVASSTVGRLPKGESDIEATANILITEHTCEPSDSDESLNTVKFTWRYADNRPLLPLQNDAGVFDETFKSPYA